MLTEEVWTQDMGIEPWKQVGLFTSVYDQLRSTIVSRTLELTRTWELEITTKMKI